MNRRNHHRPALLAIALVAITTTLSACGGGVSDQDQIASLVKDEGTNPASLCGHLTDAVLVRFGGKSSCLRAAATAAKDPSTRATAVKVHGATATAVVSDRSGKRTIKFVKQKGVWLIAGAQ